MVLSPVLATNNWELSGSIASAPGDSAYSYVTQSLHSLRINNADRVVSAVGDRERLAVGRNLDVTWVMSDLCFGDCLTAEKVNCYDVIRTGIRHIASPAVMRERHGAWPVLQPNSRIHVKRAGIYNAQVVGSSIQDVNLVADGASDQRRRTATDGNILADLQCAKVYYRYAVAVFVADESVLAKVTVSRIS